MENNEQSVENVIEEANELTLQAIQETFLTTLRSMRTGKFCG